ncbi:MAG: hypothetical protein HOY76_52465 [Streptomyces sp.]|nr:hypothetical protein [Streptomyces sp.]
MTASSRPAGARGRGRPALGDGFTATTQQAFLDAVTAGAKLTEAAAKVGVSRNVPSQHAKTDPAFRAALDEAKARGRAVRAATMPHSELHYNHYGCRAPECRAIAAAARARRRDDTTIPAEETPVTAQPIPITGRTPESSTSFSLARAS